MTGWKRPASSWRPVAKAVAAGSLVAMVAAVLPASVNATTTKPSSASYVVQMASEPVVAYEGGAGLAATKPGPGEKIDPQSRRVINYVEHLKTRHNGALDRIGGGKKLYDYTYAFNGFAARLTPDQAADLEALPDVVSVTKDRIRRANTSSTPSFLGLDERGGLWDQLGGPSGTKHRDGAGEDVIIGVVDSGIWPGSESFADRDAQGNRVYQPLKGFHGRCASAEKVGDDSWDANLCNTKLVAARHFNTGWGGDEGVESQLPWEFTSPRDYNGHGTHTAATAGGNHGVTATGAETLGTASGLAPRARVAAYKALWSNENASTASGYTSDLVAAIDQAVADGVDVINFSVSGTVTNFLDPIEVAFLYAADAGVFVSAAAGNAGPTSRTVAHPSPWITTVAAGTHNRVAEGAVTLGNGDTYTGPSIAARIGPASLVVGADSGLPDEASWQAGLCYPASANDGQPVLDSDRVEGTIVICDDGNIPSSAKSRAVDEAGGVGMILAENWSSPVPEVHAVPTVNVSRDDGAAIKAYAATGDATATIEAATIRTDEPAPYTASFSSRGPLFAGGGNLLKPDLTAPGQDILAAIAPPGNDGLDFKLASGTSMSAPHVAGLAALLKHQHPAWSPMMIKSALMTTASDVRDGSPTDPSVIFRQGAGHVRPNGAADPGLAYDTDAADWIAFLCGSTTGVDPETCAALEDEGHSLDPNDLNTASIAIGEMSGPEEVTREVTNVGRQTATYTAAVEGLEGLDVTVSPSRLTLEPGQTQAFTVRIERDTAAPNRYYGGQLTWTDGTHTVRTPIVARLSRPTPTDWRVESMAGGPTFDVSSQTGYFQPELPIRPGKTAGDGVGVGAALRWGDDGQGKRVVRFGVDGWVELDGLGTDNNGDMLSYVYATAPDGTAVGNAMVYADDGSHRGNRPVRWDAESTEATELEGLGTSAGGQSFGAANVINAEGTVAGEVNMYPPDGTNLGRRAVRWDAGQTEVTLLDHIGTNANGQTNTWTQAINRNGTIVGSGQKRTESGENLGTRAIRWDAGGIAATELDVLGTDSRGSSSAQAYDINDAGTTIGDATPYVDGASRGRAAVRWDAGGTSVTQLDTLGASEDGFMSSSAYAIANDGTIVGSSNAYGDDGSSIGTRAVMWEAGGTDVTELEQLEVSPAGDARSTAFDVNDDGLIVGQAFAFSEEGPGDSGYRAVAWDVDGELVDLTALLPPDSGWTLTRAMSISDTGWITGIGLYDPDGSGGVGAYERLFLLRITPA